MVEPRTRRRPAGETSHSRAKSTNAAARCLPATAAALSSAAARPDSAREVLAGEGAGRHVGSQRRDRCRRLRGPPPSPDCADPSRHAKTTLYRKFRGCGQRHAERSRSLDRLRERLGCPVADAPSSSSPRFDHRRYLGDEVADRQARRWLHRVDQVDVVESHAAERTVELGGIAGPVSDRGFRERDLGSGGAGVEGGGESFGVAHMPKSRDKVSTRRCQIGEQEVVAK